MLGVIICKYASPRACFQMIAAIFNAALDVFARPPAKRERLSVAAPLCSHHQLFISSHPPSLFHSTSPFNLTRLPPFPHFMSPFVSLCHFLCLLLPLFSSLSPAHPPPVFLSNFLISHFSSLYFPPNPIIFSIPLLPLLCYPHQTQSPLNFSFLWSSLFISTPLFRSSFTFLPLTSFCNLWKVSVSVLSVSPHSHSFLLPCMFSTASVYCTGYPHFM